VGHEPEILDSKSVVQHLDELIFSGRLAFVDDRSILAVGV
jgi:hypothetical protein